MEILKRRPDAPVLKVWLEIKGWSYLLSRDPQTGVLFLTKFEGGEPRECYRLDLAVGSCACPAFCYGSGAPCKHIKALLALAKVLEQAFNPVQRGEQEACA